jgi:hypothetical protein
VGSKSTYKPRCAGITSSGKRCTHPVSTPGGLCYSHDPTRAQQRKEIASKGGKLSRKGNPVEEVVGLRARLDEILEDVLEGEITTAKGQVAATIIGVSLRSFEVEKKQKEFLELERRLSEVEKMYARKGDPTDSDGYSFGSGR